MRILPILGISAVILTACGQGGRSVAVASAACSQRPPAYGRFNTLDIRVTADIHTQVAELERCPNKAYSIDFSESDLWDPGNEPLLTAMQREAVLGGAPIALEISGMLRRSRDDELRDVIVVDRILRFKLLK